MKKLHKKAAAVLFAAAMAGLSTGTAFTGLPGSMTVWAEEAEKVMEAPAETQEEAAATEAPAETQEEAAATEAPAETQPDEQTEAATEEKATEKVPEEAAENVQADAAPETETAEEQPEVQITLTSPEGWQTEKTSVGIQVEDAKNTGSFSIAKVEARISEDGGWMDVTQAMSVEITSNCSVYVRVTDQNGRTYEQNRYVECFDKAKPILSAAAKDGVLLIQGADEGSGVAAIYVNGNEFTELTDGALKVRLQKADTTYQHFTLQVRDKAGNLSENYKVANPYYENPDAKPETSDGTGEEQKNNSLQSDATATPPTNATGTVTEHQSTGGTSSEPAEPENVTIEPDTDTGRVQGTSSGTAQEGGKEFYTIQTKGDKIFYLIVDKDKTDDNVYLLTEVGENDLLNFTDSNTVTLPQNNAVLESALPLEPVEEAEEPDTSKEEEKTEKEPEKEAEKPESNSGTILLMVVVLAAVGGGYYYLKFVKGKNNAFDSDYDEEEEDEEEESADEADEEMEENEPEEENGASGEDEYQ